VRSPICIVPFRDIVGITMRNKIAGYDINYNTMIQNMNIQLGILKSLRNTGLPTILISFETLKNNPSKILERLGRIFENIENFNHENGMAKLAEGNEEYLKMVAETRPLIISRKSKK